MALHLLITTRNRIFVRLKPSSAGQGAFSLVEAMFATALVAGFFVSLFALSTQCLYFANASRELVAAGQTGQTRLEQLRDCTWAQVTSASYIHDSILNSAVTGASTLGSVTEVVKVDGYPTALNPYIQVTRAGNGTVTIDSTNNATAANDMAIITVTLTWTASPAARSRSIVVSTVYAENSK